MKHFAKKSLGQNFLQNTIIRDKILSKAGDLTGKNILEIGPGFGFLTNKLLQAKAFVTAIELDPRLIIPLGKDFGHCSNFKLIEGDILEQNLDQIFDKKKYSVIANIPYNITAYLLRRLLSDTINKPQVSILMVQKEVAKKICDLKKRSLLSLSIEIFATAEYLFDVSRENFAPIPRVDSAIIKLTLRSESLIQKKDLTTFFKIIHIGFSQKRKKLRNVFQSTCQKLTINVLGEVNMDRRAESLTVKEWIGICNRYINEYKNIIDEKK